MEYDRRDKETGDERFYSGLKPRMLCSVGLFFLKQFAVPEPCTAPPEFFQPFAREPTSSSRRQVFLFFSRLRRGGGTIPAAGGGGGKVEC